MEGEFFSAIQRRLHAVDDQKDLWQAVSQLGDIGAEASAARKRPMPLPSSTEDSGSLNWLLWLWPYLNTKPPSPEAKSKAGGGHSLDGVSCKIPDTVIFVNNSVDNFFFSSREHGGAVKRKSRQSSCTREEVLKHFKRHHKRHTSSDIIACFISLPVGSTYARDAPASVLYMDIPALETFLSAYSNPPLACGVVLFF